MRIVFFGHVRYSAILLERVRRVPGADVVGIVTRAAGASHADFHGLSPAAAEFGIPCLEADLVPEDAWPLWLRRLDADVGFALGWSRLLQRPVIDAFRHGIVGYHPAPLPRNRGHHPIIWAVALGLEETASTLFLLDEGVDSGDIVSQRRVAIAPEDDAGTMYEKLTAIVGDQIEEVVGALGAGRLDRCPQDHSLKSVWRRRGHADGQIDWRMSARSIHNLVRALTRPYVGAHAVVDGQDVRIWRTRLPEQTRERDDVEPGRVLAVTGGQFRVKCGEGELEIVEHELGRTPVPGRCLR